MQQRKHNKLKSGSVRKNYKLKTLPQDTLSQKHKTWREKKQQSCSATFAASSNELINQQ
jgi:hypothetical protein